MIAILGTTSYIHSPLTLRLRAGFKIHEQPIRVKRSATLAAESVLVHSGFTANDKIMILPCDMTREEHETLIDLVTNETIFTLSVDGGFYTGAISNISQTDGITITFLPSDQELAATPVAAGGGQTINTNYQWLSFSSAGYSSADEAQSDWKSSGQSTTYLRFGYSDIRGIWISGILFPASTVPAAPVGGAVITFSASSSTSAHFSVEIAVQNTLAGTSPSSPTDLWDLEKFPLCTTWDIDADWANSQLIQTPDIADTLNQALTQDDYDGGHIMVLMTTKATVPGASFLRGSYYGGTSISLHLNP